MSIRFKKTVTARCCLTLMILSALAAIAWSSAAWAAPAVMFDPIEVTTLAGDGTAGFADGIGTSAKFYNPYRISLDTKENLWVTDYRNNRIRKVDIATRAVTTFAGDGTIGFADGIGTAAKFPYPSGVVASTEGKLYVADCTNNRIRQIDTATGVVTTLAGQTVNGWLDGIGTAAKFDCPIGIAADTSGNLYVADSSNHRIRRIVIASGEVTTFAGSGTNDFADGIGTSAKFSYPSSVVTDTSDNLYVADNQRIRRIIIATAEVTTLAGSGTYDFADGIGTTAKFAIPSDTVADTAGNLYVADDGNNRIRKVVIATGEVKSLAGQNLSGWSDGIGATAKFNNPSGIAIDTAGNLYVADFNNNRIRKMAPPTLTAFSAISGTASPALSFSISGNSLTADITVTAPTGYEVSLSSGSGYAPSLNITPTSGVVNLKMIYIRLSASAGVGDYNGNITLASAGAATQTLPVSGTIVASPSSVIFDPVISTLAGSTLGYVNGIGSAAKFWEPIGIATDTSGNLYVADYRNFRIRKIAIDTGEVTLLAGAGGEGGFADGTGSAARFNYPSGVAADTAGNLYVTDAYNHCIRKIVTSSGTVTTLAGQAVIGWLNGIGTAAKFCYPRGIASDSLGNLYVTDSLNHCIRKIDTATGAVTTLAGGVQGFADGIGSAAMFNRPVGVAADTSGNLYVTDSVNNRIRKIDTATGTVTTLAGSSQGFADSIGTIAQFSNPYGVTADTSGNLYVADRSNNRIRKISIATGVVTTIAGQASGGWLDGIGTATKFYNPSGVIVNTMGDLYVADYNNNRIRKMTSPTLVAFSTTDCTASDAQFFGISGYFLTDSLTVTAPTGYEVSLSSGSDYAPSLNITPASGMVNSKMIYIRLSASAGAGIYNGNITLDSAGATQKTLAVTGTVFAPEISLKQGTADIASGSSYNFGNVNIGSNSGAIPFTIENIGTVNLILSGAPKVAISGSSDFSVDQSGVTSPIAASGSRSFTVTFTPSYTGAKNAVITVANNDGNEGSYSVTLNGTGTAAPITAGVSMVSVSNVKATTAFAEAYSGESGATERGFYWWNDTRYWGDNASGPIPAGGSGAGGFSLTLSNLPVKTQLYVSAYVKIGDQLITSGNKISITTTDPIMPTVITKPDFTVNGNEVLAKGEITDVGKSSVTIYGFVYAKHTSPTVWDSALPFTWDNTLPISSGKAFEGIIKSLAAGTYYFRAYAHNSQGTAYGEEFSFTITGGIGDCGSGVPGDLNGDGSVNLTDVIIALKVLDGVSVGSLSLKGDVNSDCKIGLEEAIFVLQTVAGVK